MPKELCLSCYPAETGAWLEHIGDRVVGLDAIIPAGETSPRPGAEPSLLYTYSEYKNMYEG